MNKFSIINKFFYFLLSLVFLIIPFYVQAEVTASGNIILPPLPDVPNTPTTPTTPLVPTTPPPYIDPTTSNVYSAAFDAIHYLYFGALVPTPDYAQLAKDVAAEDATIQAQNQGYGAGGTSGNTSGSGGNTSGSDGSTANPTAAQIQQMQNAGVGKQYSGTSAGINTSSLTGIYPDKVCTTDGTCTYKLLAPIGGFLGENGVYILKRNDSKSLCALLNSWFRIGIALAGLLAVVMIVIGGIQYATTDAMTDKSGGKEKIMNALWGLLLALTTYLILNTVNPALTNCEIQAKPVVLDNLQITSSALSVVGNPLLGAALTANQMANNTLTNWGDPNASLMTGQSVAGRQTYYASGETNSDSNTDAGLSAMGKLIEGTPTVVGSAASVYYPAGTLVEVNGIKYVIDDNNLLPSGKPANQVLTNNYTVDIYTTNVNKANTTTTRNNMTVLYVPTTKVGASGVADIRNNPSKYINSNQ